VKGAGTVLTPGASSRIWPDWAGSWKCSSSSRELEHLRQHERVIQADRKVQEQVDHFALETPKVTHLIGTEPGGES
jgi:hypothetical protein